MNRRSNRKEYDISVECITIPNENHLRQLPNHRTDPQDFVGIGSDTSFTFAFFSVIAL